MTGEYITEPASSRGNWVDVRMQDPDEGGWELDAVVADGQVEHVDLRIRPNSCGPSWIASSMTSTTVTRRDALGTRETIRSHASHEP